MQVIVIVTLNEVSKYKWGVGVHWSWFTWRTLLDFVDTTRVFPNSIAPKFNWKIGAKLTLNYKDTKSIQEY